MPIQNFPSAGAAVAVTSAGIVSPLGCGLDATRDSLRAGRDAVTPVEAFDVSRCKSSSAGQVTDSMLPPPESRREKRLHRASRMMIAAAREVMAGDPAFAPEMILIGTTSGGMTFGEAYYRSLASGGRPPARGGWVANYSPQKQVLDTQAAIGSRAPARIIANACASGTNAIGEAFSLIRSGRCRSVLCGGCDALSELVFVGFDSLQASTAEKCRPFDKARTGLVLGEGAALLALESLDSARERGAPILAIVSGYGISTDNHHLTQPHPSGIGPFLAMSRALASAGRKPEEVDYINAHGTATLFNDATEGAAIARLFGRTPVSSTKSMMGHSLGAAGAIEAVFSLLALRDQFIPPNINFTGIDPAWDLDLVANTSRSATLRCVISNSFGFGGTNATLVMEEAPE